jgi:hypothetical protein
LPAPVGKPGAIVLGKRDHVRSMMRSPISAHIPA